MKKFIYIASFVFISSNLFAHNDLNINKEIKSEVDYNFSYKEVGNFNLLNELNLDKSDNYSVQIVNSEKQELYDCVITVQQTINGTVVDITVTIYDVTRIGCAKLKTIVAAALVAAG